QLSYFLFLAGPNGHSSHRMPTASMWGAVGTVGLVWATAWWLILDWVPYINGKFKKED
uniref:Cytochrome b-c1 complex subunit 10 n=1 Tax=Spermophilus dauricus TaxID=99837 RepID=A0A8C9PD61_SPEDA